MIKIRLSRYGRKKAAFYRIVAIEESFKREGKPLEVIGFWNPVKGQKDIDLAKLKAWIQKGAKVTGAVEKLLKSK